jgi:cell wall-associated NlpC family hydrolase
MKPLFFLPVLLFIAACSGGNKINRTGSISILQPHIDSTARQYAPDPRTALFKITAKGNVLTGETNEPAAKNALLDKLKAANLQYVDSILVLPVETLDSKTRAVVSNSVANLRLMPRHQAELTTQATLGTPLIVLKKERGWYYVQTPDKYLAWVDGGAITSMNDESFNKWQQSKKLMYNKPYGFALSKADKQSPTISDLVYGDIVTLKNELPGYFEIGFPDGRAAYVPVGEAVVYTDWVNSRRPTEDSLVATARNLLGLPYLWGGTSFKGVDCSGFTKTVYFINGLVLPRDASQQATIGTVVTTAAETSADISAENSAEASAKSWDKLRPGDLLFFGSPARDGNPARVVHVGMWIGGQQEFIHSSGRVQISSMNASATNYSESEKRRFLFARRITAADAAVDLRKTPVFEGMN